VNYRKFFLAWYTVIALFFFGLIYAADYEVPSPAFGQTNPPPAWVTNSAQALATAAVWPLWLSVKIFQRWVRTQPKAACASIYMT
jgi:hypothetical protein